MKVWLVRASCHDHYCEGDHPIAVATSEADAVRLSLPCTYVEGRSYAVQAMRGGAALGRIRVLSVAREDIAAGEGRITEEEARREGFACPEEFWARWWELHGVRRGDVQACPTDVWRIAFQLQR